MDTFSKTERTTLKRLPNRGSYDRETVYGILDEGLICHVGFVVDGHPRVLPTGYVRIGDTLYVHGSPASVMLKSAAGTPEICVTVTLLDGLVLARSAFHHSMNYRSVVVYGAVRFVEDESEKMAVLEAFVEHIVPGRWVETRIPTPRELKGTSVLGLPLLEASAKIRTGPPIDDKEDYDLDFWAGVVPLTLVAGKPLDDPELKPGLNVPDYASSYTRNAHGNGVGD